MTTSAAFPPSFMGLQDNVKVVAVGAIAEHISGLCRGNVTQNLSLIPEAVHMSLNIEVSEDGVPISAELDWPSFVLAEQREVIAYSIGVGMHQYAIEFARRLELSGGLSDR